MGRGRMTTDLVGKAFMCGPHEYPVKWQVISATDTHVTITRVEKINHTMTVDTNVFLEEVHRYQSERR